MLEQVSQTLKSIVLWVGGVFTFGLSSVKSAENKCTLGHGDLAFFEHTLCCPLIQHIAPTVWALKYKKPS